MTKRDIFTQIIMEASGFPAAAVTDYAAKVFQVIDHHANLDEPLSDHEAQVFIALLRPQIPGIKQWLTRARTEAEADIAEMQGKMH